MFFIFSILNFNYTREIINEHPIVGKKNPWLVFFTVSMGVFLSTMDSSMVNVALPCIMHSFGSSLVQTEWIVLIYLLTITTSLLFWGRFSDHFCKRRVYVVGMAIFTAASLACSLTPSLISLYFCRFVQAVGASMMMATGPAIIKDAFPQTALGQILGLIGLATSSGLMLGPVIAGFLIHSYSWRSIFLVSVPVGGAACVLGYSSMRPFPLLAVNWKEISSFDWPGMVLWTVLLSSTVFLATAHIGAESSAVWILAVLFFLSLLALIYVELKTENPFFPVGLFRNRSYAIAMFCAALSFAVLFVVLILIPFYLSYVLQLTARDVGLVMMATPLSVLIVSPLSGFLYNRLGARLLTTVGLSIAACGLFLLCLLTVSTSALDVAWRLAVLGCGQALFLAPNSTTVLENVSAEQTGVSAGMLATARNLGMLAGASMAGFLFGSFFYQLSGGLDLQQYTPSQAENFIVALRITFILTGICSIVGAVLSGLRSGRGRTIS